MILSLLSIYWSTRLTRSSIHHDIKPNNILVSIRTGPSKFDVEFKLADLGLANFEPEGQDGKGVHRRDVSGTQMFSKSINRVYLLVARY